MAEGMSISTETDFEQLDLLLHNAGEADDGLDFLQQAIIAGNQSAVSYLLLKSYKPVVYHPPCNEYLHLACKLNRDIMVKFIIECRPEDMHILGRVCFPNPCFHEHPTKSGMVCGGQKPMDIIVNTGNSASLVALLTHLSQRDPNRLPPAALLCVMNHPDALALLIKTHASTHDELKTAYTQALQRKRHACVSVLISAGYKELSIRQINPYHALYCYYSGYTPHASRHDGLAATTSVLLKAGADITSCRPVGSFPLYSILDLILKDSTQYGEEYLSESISRELIDCLKLILKQGVRIDLDENHLSLSIREYQEQPAYGRDTYTSVFDLISRQCMKLENINLAASEILRECSEVLMTYRGNHQIKPTYLSGIVHIMGRSGHSKSIMKNLESILMSYLDCGVRTNLPIPQAYGVGQYGCASANMYVYLVNQYVESLCDCEVKTNLAHTVNAHQALRWIINTMTYNSICSANQISIRIISRLKDMEKLTPSLLRLITKPPLLRLKTLAARVVWFTVARRKENLSKLPIPNSVKASLLDTITKEI